MANKTRPPTTVEELIPYIDTYGIHLHYNIGQDRWTFVGASQHALKYCAPETCYTLKLKNHRKENPGD